MKNLLILPALFLSCLAFGQVPNIPTRGSEDTDAVMSPAYWALWNDEVQQKIDADIDLYRKADGIFRTGRIKKGSSVKVEQLSSEFQFGASAFNFGQLGSAQMNSTYRISWTDPKGKAHSEIISLE